MYTSQFFEYCHTRLNHDGVLIVSSELDEIMGLSDRILVMFDGRIVGEVAVEGVDERTLGLMMAGVDLAPAAVRVGFAAETEALEANARKKLHTKSLDMVAANVVGPGRGFEVDDNALQVFWDGGQQQFGQTRKTRLARQLVALLAHRYKTKYDKHTVIKLHAKDSA